MQNFYPKRKYQAKTEIKPTVVYFSFCIYLLSKSIFASARKANI